MHIVHSNNSEISGVYHTVINTLIHDEKEVIALSPFSYEYPSTPETQEVSEMLELIPGLFDGLENGFIFDNKRTNLNKFIKESKDVTLLRKRYYSNGTLRIFFKEHPNSSGIY